MAMASKEKIMVTGKYQVKSGLLAQFSLSTILFIVEYLSCTYICRFNPQEILSTFCMLVDGNCVHFFFML